MILLFLYGLVCAFLLVVLHRFGADGSLLFTWGAALAIPAFIYGYSVLTKIRRRNRRRTKKSVKTVKTVSALKKAA